MLQLQKARPFQTHAISMGNLKSFISTGLTIMKLEDKSDQTACGNIVQPGRSSDTLPSDQDYFISEINSLYVFTIFKELIYAFAIQ